MLMQINKWVHQLSLQECTLSVSAVKRLSMPRVFHGNTWFVRYQKELNNGRFRLAQFLRNRRRLY